MKLENEVVAAESRNDNLIKIYFSLASSTMIMFYVKLMQTHSAGISAR